MNDVFAKPSWWQRLRPWFAGFDLPLLLALAWLIGLGLLCM
jgi:rod shape determining protein RodA